jgi:tungstate transport system substrate-binding protein
MPTRRILLAAAFAAALCAPALAQDKSIVVASTTSTQDSGLFEYLLPIFKQATGITVKVIAQGTGQALDTARRGVAMLTWCSSIPKRLKKDSCRKASG